MCQWLESGVLAGIYRPISYKGVITDTYREFSDALAMFWMKGSKPWRYRENLISFTSTAPSMIQINLGEIGKAEPKGESKEEEKQASEGESGPSTDV